MDTHDNLTTRVRAALKQKWLANDHDVDVKKMCAYFEADEATLIGIIMRYECDLLATRFNLK